MEKRECASILFRKGNTFLFQKKTQDYKKAPGLWALFGGGIEKGETPKGAAIREAKEELGIGINEKDIKLVFSKEYKTSSGIVKFYIFESEFKFTISNIVLGEGDGFGFFTKKEALELNFMEGDREVLKEVIK